MLLTTPQAYDLLAKYGAFAREICDKCGAVLGAVRFTRRGDSGIWCSRDCRGDGERRAIRKGGRPRKYKDERMRKNAHVQQQRDSRLRSSVTKTPSNIARNKGLAGAKSGSLALLPIRPTSAQETACNENGGARV